MNANEAPRSRRWSPVVGGGRANVPLTSALVLPRRFEAEPPQQQAGRYRNWNPPLLGNLPDGFLRILPQQLDSVKVTQTPDLGLPC